MGAAIQTPITPREQEDLLGNSHTRIRVPALVVRRVSRYQDDGGVFVLSYPELRTKEDLSNLLSRVLILNTLSENPFKPVQLLLAIEGFHCDWQVFGKGTLAYHYILSMLP